MNEHEKAAKAAQQVEAITGFYIHLIVFVLVMALLFVVNWMTVADKVGGCNGRCSAGASASCCMPGPSSAPRRNFIPKWQLRKIKELKDKM